MKLLDNNKRMILDNKMNNIISLIEQVNDDFLLTDFPRCIVPSSFPIIWFGDIKSFLNSETKIITVSLNPSNNEFGNSKKNIPYSTQFRFPDYDGSIESLITAFNNYFKLGRKPYNSWFKASFSAILESFDASHYDIAKNNALHTDIAIPYATDPTWTGLTNAEKQYFEPIGQKIWHDLINILEPDIILISASGGFQNKILFPKVHENWEVIIPKEKYPVLFNQIKVNNKISDVIFQTQGRKPFLNMTKEEKMSIKNTLELHKNGKA
jgi:hypothetical protein